MSLVEHASNLLVCCPDVLGKSNSKVTNLIVVSNQMIVIKYIKSETFSFTDILRLIYQSEAVFQEAICTYTSSIQLLSS